MTGKPETGPEQIDALLMLADDGEAIRDIAALAEQPGLHGPVASPATAWRVLDAVDDRRLANLQVARAAARERAWLARGEITGRELPASRAAGHDLDYVVIDLDATLLEVHSEKEQAAGTFKGGYGYHPLLAFLDNTNEALAGILRPGNAGSNTAADHIAVLGLALAQLPDAYRAKRILIRTDGAGFSHAFLDHLVEQELEYSVGFAVTDDLRAVGGDEVAVLGLGVPPEAVVEDRGLDQVPLAWAGREAVQVHEQGAAVAIPQQVADVGVSVDDAGWQLEGEAVIGGR